MNKQLLIIAIAILGLGTFFISCQTAAQKEDAAEANVEDAQQELTEAQKDVIAQEWKVFKTDTERRIDKIENRITELKVQLKTSGNTIDNAYGKSIDALEQQNKDLRARMVTYEGNQSDWESFKREFNHDMDKLAQALNDITVNNKG